MALTPEMLADLEAELRGLLKGEFCSLTISFNDQHAPNYATAQRYADEFGQYEADDGWVSPEERTKALATNSVWDVHWYPNTPIGSYSVKASSLTACLEYIRQGDFD